MTTIQSKVTAVSTGRSKRKVALMVGKALTLILGRTAEEWEGQDGEDPLIAACMRPDNSVLGFTFEPGIMPSFSSLLKVGRTAEKRSASMESGLERAIEAYDGRRRLIAVVSETTDGTFFIYTGTPGFEECPVSFLRMEFSNRRRDDRRYICSLSALLEGMCGGDINP